jgi:hypothetical protein
LSREQIIERERRWALPAAIAALVATALMVASFVARLQVPIEDAMSAQLRAFDAHSGAVATFSVLAAAAFALFSAPLLYLFRAAQARNPRVQRTLVAFCFIGPVLMGAQAIVNWVAVSQISSDFVEQAPNLQSEPYQRLLADVKSDGDTIDKVTLYTEADPPGVDIELTNGQLLTSEYPAAGEQTLINRLDAAGVDHEEDSNGEVGDVLAQRISDDSTAVQVGGSLQFPALLGLIIGMVYVPLQAVRVGLLTRFFGSLGMALGVSVILLPPAPAMVALWFGWLGLLYVGRVPGGRPPSWEAGVAIPWPRPGEEEASASGSAGDAIEGEATEVSAGAGPAAGSEPGQPRKRKRKRRR